MDGAFFNIYLWRVIYTFKYTVEYCIEVKFEIDIKNCDSSLMFLTLFVGNHLIIHMWVLMFFFLSFCNFNICMRNTLLHFGFFLLLLWFCFPSSKYHHNLNKDTVFLNSCTSMFSAFIFAYFFIFFFFVPGHFPINFILCLFYTILGFYFGYHQKLTIQKL